MTDWVSEWELEGTAKKVDDLVKKMDKVEMAELFMEVIAHHPEVMLIIQSRWNWEVRMMMEVQSARDGVNMTKKELDRFAGDTFDSMACDILDKYYPNMRKKYTIEMMKSLEEVVDDIEKSKAGE